MCDEKEGRKEEGKERKEEEERKRERERGKGGRREGGEKEKLGAAGACTGGKQGVLDHVRALLPKVVLRGPGHTEYISRKHCQSEISSGGAPLDPADFDESQSCPVLSAVTHIALLTPL